MMAKTQRKSPRREGASTPDVARAIDVLSARGQLTGARSKKLSVRVDPGAYEAAARRLGLDNASDLVNAAIALAAAPDRFKAWLRDPGGRLSEDFELAL